MSFSMNFNPGDDGYKIEHHAYRAGEVPGLGAYASLQIRGGGDYIALYSSKPENIRAMAAALELAAMALERAIADSEKAKLVADVLAKHEPDLPAPTLKDPFATLTHKDGASKDEVPF